MSTSTTPNQSTDDENILLEIFRADIAVLRQRAARNSRVVADDDVDPTLHGYARQAAIRRRASHD